MELKDKILDKYRTKIIHGELKSGTIMPTQREMAENESISKSVANSIIIALEREGLITTYPRKKTIVADWKNYPTPLTLPTIVKVAERLPNEELIKAFEEFRIINEGKCAALAAQRRTDEDIKHLRAALKKIISSEKMEDFADAHLEFHKGIFIASHNFLYAAIAESFKGVFYCWGRLNYDTDLRKTNELLEKILEYIEKKDSMMAEAAMNIYSYESSLILNSYPKHI